MVTSKLEWISFALPVHLIALKNFTAIYNNFFVSILLFFALYVYVEHGCIAVCWSLNVSILSNLN